MKTIQIIITLTLVLSVFMRAAEIHIKKEPITPVDITIFFLTSVIIALVNWSFINLI